MRRIMTECPGQHYGKARQACRTHAAVGQLRSPFLSKKPAKTQSSASSSHPDKECAAMRVRGHGQGVLAQKSYKRAQRGNTESRPRKGLSWRETNASAEGPAADRFALLPGAVGRPAAAPRCPR